MGATSPATVVGPWEVGTQVGCRESVRRMGEWQKKNSYIEIYIRNIIVLFGPVDSYRRVGLGMWFGSPWACGRGHEAK